MQKPPSVIPILEAIQFSESRKSFTMPTPDPVYKSVTLQQRPDGSLAIDGRNGLSEEETLDMLRAWTLRIESDLQQKTQTETKPQTLTNIQPTDDCDGIPAKKQIVDNSTTSPLSISTVFPTVQVVNTSVEENTPTALQKPCFGNEKTDDLLADILKQSGIVGTKPLDEIAEAKPQISLGLENDAAEELSYKPECLPDLEVFQDANVQQGDFELESTDVHQLMTEDPDLTEAIEATYSASVDLAVDVTKEEQPVVDLGDFTGGFSLDAGTTEDEVDDMGPYRNPPSVASIVSNSTYTSEYPSILSPCQEFEACEESFATPVKVTGRRGSRRRVSGGKDLKRLNVGPKPLVSSSGKPYPTATAQNGKLSRHQLTDYTESILYEHWWAMVRKVEEMLKKNIDYQSAKVEDLRKYCHDLFAVAMYAPVEWGNNQKRKGIYKMDKRDSLYKWQPSVPFCSLNNGPKTNNGDAPRAKKDDLVLITPYLVYRYTELVRPKIIMEQENGQKGPLPPLEQVQAPAVLSNFVPPVVPKIEPVDAEVNKCDFPVPVSQPAATFQAVKPEATYTSVVPAAESEQNNTVIMSSDQGCSTLDVNQLSQILGNNMFMFSNETTDTFDSFNIQPRQVTEPMDTDSELMYANPEMKKAGSSNEHLAKVKLEHSYSIPDDDEIAQAKMQGMATYQDSGLPGTVLELPEGSSSQVTQATDQDTYIVQKLMEIRPDLYESVLSVIDTQVQPTS